MKQIFLKRRPLPSICFQSSKHVDKKKISPKEFIQTVFYTKGSLIGAQRVQGKWEI